MKKFYNNKRKQQTNKVEEVKTTIAEKVENVAGMLQNAGELEEIVKALVKEFKEIKAEKKTTGKVSSRNIKDLTGLIGIAIAIFVGASNGEQVDTSAMLKASGIVTDTSTVFVALQDDVKNISTTTEELSKTDSIYRAHLVFDKKGNLILK